MNDTNTVIAGERTQCDCGMCDDCWDTYTGEQIAEVLKLQQDPEYPDLWQTIDGNKTSRGIARTVAAILEGTY